MKFTLLACLFLAALTPLHAEPTCASFSLTASRTLSTSDRILARAFKTKTSGFMVKLKGTVIRKLPDDTAGSRHQRFIVRLASQQTLLIAHNIDLAPRVSGLRTNKPVTIYGEYIWNAQGGIIHQTHHRPDGSRGGGWIRYQSAIYQ